MLDRALPPFAIPNDASRLADGAARPLGISAAGGADRGRD